MNQIFEFAQIYYVEVICVAVLFSLLSIILVILNFRRTSRIIRKYKRLMRGADNKNLEKNQSEFRSRLKRSTQHIGVVRYNAFDHMGSDQSFSIAMLDEYGDGFVLTSLYGRNTSCTFAKPINHRQSSYPLSDEEQEAIRKAFT